MRERVMAAVVTAAVLVTAWTEAPHWLAAAARAFERLSTPRAVRERNEERVLVTQVLDAVAESPRGERMCLVLPSPPALGDEATYLVYRLRVKLYPRPLDVVFLDGNTWRAVDLDYGKTTPARTFASLDEALDDADLAILVGGLAAVPAGFVNATPAGAFGFALRRRALR